MRSFSFRFFTRFLYNTLVDYAGLQLSLFEASITKEDIIYRVTLLYDGSINSYIATTADSQILLNLLVQLLLSFGCVRPSIFPLQLLKAPLHHFKTVLQLYVASLNLLRASEAVLRQKCENGFQIELASALQFHLQIDGFPIFTHLLGQNGMLLVAIKHAIMAVCFMATAILEEDLLQYIFTFPATITSFGGLFYLHFLVE